MNIIKNYQKNIKESKGKNKHNDYFEELKETSSPSKDYSLPFPFFKKIIEADILSPKLAISIKCPYKDCCVTFYVSKEDFNNCSMIICPKGHNICSKCENLSHFPISCQSRRNWDENQLDSVKKQHEANLKITQCPICERVIASSSYGKNIYHCAVCNKYICNQCMKELGPYSFSHHCKEEKSKGALNSKAKEFFKVFNEMETHYDKYLNEKIQKEEDLIKMRKFFERKTEKMHYDDESISNVCYFVDALNEIRNCLFLGKNFKILISKEKKETKTKNIIKEIEEIYGSLEMLNSLHLDSYDVVYKKFIIFIKDKDSIKVLQKLKTLMFRLESIFEKNG